MTAGKHTVLALDAIRACQRGDVDAGVQQYREALAAPDGLSLPVGLHTALLAGAGHHDAAAAIRTAGMVLGLDLSTCWWARKGDPAAAVTEYQQLFAKGIGTPCMVEHYQEALSVVGDAEMLARVSAPGTLFRAARLPVTLDPVLGDAAAALRHASSRQFEENRRSIRAMDRVINSHRLADPGVVAIHAAVHALVAAYLSDVKQSGHLIAPWLPADFELRSWGVISDGRGGYNAPHTHSGCWTVAVAYLEGEDPRATGRGDQGVLRVGPSEGGNADCAGWPNLSVAPIPGTVVIMPGFYTHWTMPITDGAGRVSLAFNVIPRLPADNPDAPLNEIAAEQDGSRP